MMEGTREKIRNILTKLSVIKPPVPLDKVAELFGLTIVPYPQMPLGLSGFTTKDRDKIFIALNTNISEQRKRFTIAHEIGHFLLGHEIDYQVNSNVIERPRDQEREADQFAGELLMPFDFLRDALSGSGSKVTIPTLAKFFDVSDQAMAIQLSNTGLLLKI